MRVTCTVLVVSGPSIRFVDTMTSVIVVGAWVCTIVSIIVAAACGDPSAEVAAAPPSTATTEYVALRTSGSAFGGERGSDEDNKKSDDNAKSEELAVLRRMTMNSPGGLREKAGGERERYFKKLCKEAKKYKARTYKGPIEKILIYQLSELRLAMRGWEFGGKAGVSPCKEVAGELARAHLRVQNSMCPTRSLMAADSLAST